MTEPEIVNPIGVEELAEWSAVSATALLQPLSGERHDSRSHRLRAGWQPDRVWGARADGRWVGNLVTEARTLTVPAGPTGTHDLTADAVTAVGVAATHRRLGLLRGMLTGSLAAAATRGDAVSILWAAEWPIYGRFGYAPATSNNDYVLHVRRPSPLLPAPPAGALRGATPQELRTVAPAIYDLARRGRAGEVDRPDPWWLRMLALDDWHPAQEHLVFVLHEGPDGPDGLLLWKATGMSGLRDELGKAEVHDLIAASDDAYRDLWSYLCGIDIVGEVALSDRPVDEPIRWQLHDARALHTHASGDALWLRLLDVPAALSARGYAAQDRLVLDVRDDAAGGHGAGTVELRTDGAVAHCTATGAPPDLRLDQRALAACYLGGHRLRAVASGLPVAELTPGAIERFDAMFATAWSPWTSTGF